WPPSPHILCISRPGGRCRKAEESPGSTETRCRITSGGGDPRESATESKPLPPPNPPRIRGGIKGGGVRVKGWSKSPPRGWQHPRHGKPHREQSRIGMASGNRDPSSDPPFGLAA